MFSQLVFYLLIVYLSIYRFIEFASLIPNKTISFYEFFVLTRARFYQRSKIDSVQVMSRIYHRSASIN